MPSGIPVNGQRDWDRTLPPNAMVCMNPGVECSTCIFFTGALARWCPPAERQAKAELDSLQKVEAA